MDRAERFCRGCELADIGGIERHFGIHPILRYGRNIWCRSGPPAGLAFGACRLLLSIPFGSARGPRSAPVHGGGRSSLGRILRIGSRGDNRSRPVTDARCVEGTANAERSLFRAERVHEAARAERVIAGSTNGRDRLLVVP